MSDEMLTIPYRGDGDLIITRRGREAMLITELRAITAEMRSRKINHGKNVSPTLIAWADRIDAAVEDSQIGA